MDRIEKIKEMEAIYDEVSQNVKDLLDSLETYHKLQNKIEILKTYMIEEYMEDFEADERGEFPSDLKRGILAEDGLYELLVEIDHINEILK